MDNSDYYCCLREYERLLESDYNFLRTTKQKRIAKILRQIGKFISPTGPEDEKWVDDTLRRQLLGVYYGEPPNA
jgi:hypothetical protein